MTMIENLENNGLTRAFLHACLIPFLLMVLVASFDKQWTLIVPIFYVLAVSMIHLYRLRNSQNQEHIERAREFFSLVGAVSMFAIMLILVVAFLAILGD